MSIHISSAAEPGKITSPSPAAHWRVEYHYDTEAKPKPQAAADKSINRLQATEYQVFKDTAKITNFFEDGTEETEYLAGDYLYRQERRTKRPVIEAIIGDDSDRQCRKRYPEFAVPLEKLYVGTVDAFDQKCFYYRSDQQKPNSIAPPENAQEKVWEGWISCKNGRPVAFRIGNTQGNFVFFPPTPAPVSLPQVYVDLAKATFKTPPPPGSLAGKKR